MNLTKLEFKKIFTPLTVIAVVVMLLLNLYMTFDYRAAYLLAALDPDSKSKPIETLKSEYAEKRGGILLHPLRRGGLRRILAVVYRHLLSVSVDDRAGDHS